MICDKLTNYENYKGINERVYRALEHAAHNDFSKSVAAETTLTATISTTTSLKRAKLFLLKRTLMKRTAFMLTFMLMLSAARKFMFRIYPK